MTIESTIHCISSRAAKNMANFLTKNLPFADVEVCRVGVIVSAETGTTVTIHPGGKAVPYKIFEPEDLDIVVEYALSKKFEDASAPAIAE